MDVVLRTHLSDRYVGLLGLQRFADESGYCCCLLVRSPGFAGSTQFCFEPQALDEFLAAVRAMDRTLTGTARLQPLYEESYVELEVTRTGGVWVRGEVLQYQEAGTQHLRFAFDTDQTCLGPLASDLEACLQLAAI